MPRAYTMRGLQGAADRAALLCRAYLNWLQPGSRVHDVQDDPRFQHRGVDLLWEREGLPVAGIEVKGDRQGRRGNYFFELVSNVERDTPGCFLYSTADAYLYVFLDLGEVHHLPMPQTRQWFLQRASAYPLRHTRTRTGKVSYTTVGALVPVLDVLREVEGAGRFAVDAEGQVRPRPVQRRRAQATQAG